MNCKTVRESWDNYRDGQVSGERARMLEQHLADCPHCEKLWRSESGWLGVLGEKTAIEDEGEAVAFTHRVVRRWRGSVVRGPVIAGRLGRLAAAAAVVTAMLWVGNVIVRQQQTGVDQSGPVAAERPIPGGASGTATGGSDSMGVLIAGIDGPTLAVRQVFHTTSSTLDLDRYVSAAVQWLDDAALPSDASEQERM